MRTMYIYIYTLYSLHPYKEPGSLGPKTLFQGICFGWAKKEIRFKGFRVWVLGLRFNIYLGWAKKELWFKGLRVWVLSLGFSI